MKWISALLCAAVLATPLWAQDSYPSSPVKVVAPYAPGGNADLITRLYSKSMSDLLGQQFLVDNRPGGNTNVAAEAVAKSVPDGYALFLLQGTSHGTNPWLFTKLPYDPIEDFSFIGLMARTTFYLVVNVSLEVNSARELVNYARANPGKFAYASPGNATATHLAAAALDRRGEMGGLTHVPYKGDAPAIVDLFGGSVFMQRYGQTEVIGTELMHDDHRPNGTEHERHWLQSVGRPSPNVLLRIVDEDGNECPVGTPGEIVIKSTIMFRGYWNNSVATMETIRDGWCHTGDVGKVDEEGFVYLIDRKKDMIISGGENIYSREVEEAVIQHAAVSECAVIGIPDEKWGEAVCAIVLLKAGKTVTADD